ncbi:MAG TPA: hypothetical protein VEC13_02930 [Candidatus Paceibacterota bacterium]|nr:hypothetical protein [Candidatus Paceibacterota bacterium]
MREIPGQEGMEETKASFNSENQNTFTENVSNLEGEPVASEQAEAKSEKEFAEKKEQVSREDTKKAKQVRFDLDASSTEESGKKVDAEREEAKEALASILDSIQAKKLPILERIHDETHFRKAFPIHAAFKWLGGRLYAKAQYPEEYKAKVAIPEAQDELTLLRLNERGEEIAEKLALLEAADITAEAIEEILRAVQEITESMNRDDIENEIKEPATSEPESDKQTTLTTNTSESSK